MNAVQMKLLESFSDSFFEPLYIPLMGQNVNSFLQIVREYL